jgi:Rod binding domain-containing protein
MNVAGPSLTHLRGALNPKEQLQAMSDLAKEFEGVLVANLLKESLQNSSAVGAEDASSGSDTYMQMACEQMAYFVGRQGVLGIADQLVQQQARKLGIALAHDHAE